VAIEKLRMATSSSIGRSTAILATVLLSACSPSPTNTATATPQGVSAAEARAIAKEAYIYGFPMVDSYRIQHSYFVDRGGAEFKTGWNAIFNNARVYTPADKAIQTPNSDTPYSYVGADLRAEPLVLTLPTVDKGRYFSVQLIDAYTFNFAYLGSRATGSTGGSYLLAGPRWKGEPPPGIKAVIRAETDFVFALYRTQLLNPDDIDNVKKVQAGYEVQTLSAFLGTPAPAAAPVTFVQPLSPADQKTSPAFFNVLNFLLQFCPTHPSETALRERFAKIGDVAGKTFDPATLSPEMRSAIEGGIADAWKTFDEYKRTELDTGKVTSGANFGTRDHLNGNYLGRMSAAVLGIYGNSQEEAMYPVYFVDGDRQQPNGATHRYVLRFPPNELPPVNAFWSLTLYELPSSLLSANSINRYLINSPMLPQLVRDPDGGITLYLQHESPGKARQPNWLPAPNGPFFAALRLYWPKAEALDGRWRPPVLQKAK
jgi:hypothetical protein